MKKYVDGQYIEMTEEEIAEHNEYVQKEDSDEMSKLKSRIDELENCIIDLSSDVYGE